MIRDHLDKAGLLSETSAALDELNTTSALLPEHTEGLERASDAHDLFTNLVLRGGDVKDVAAAASEVLTGDLWVLDTEDRTLAMTAMTAGSLDGLGIDVSVMTEAARTAGRAVRHDDW